MKGYTAPLTILVPKRKRFSIYKKAIKIIESKKEIYGFNLNSYPICLLLPCILYKLNHYLDNTPNNEDWNFRHTVIAFPEVVELVEEVRGIDNDELKNKARLAGLKEIVK